MPFSPEAEQAVQRRMLQQPKGIQDHLRRVSEVAIRLAQAHGLDAEQARVAAFAHDLARAASEQELLAEAARLGIEVHAVEQAVPILLHGPVAAARLAQDDGVKDAELLEAVVWHSTAAPGIGPIAKVTFLADKLDPDKAHRSPGQNEMLSLAMRDLDAATAEWIGRELVSLIQRGLVVHPASVAARNEALLRPSARKPGAG